MSEYKLNAEQYLFPTPAGAYHAIFDSSDDAPRQLLRTLLRQQESQRLSSDTLSELFGHNDEQQALALLHHMQRLGWIQGEPQPRSCPTGSITDIIPDVLRQLSGSSKALLAEQQGFYLASHGFPHETAEELSALSADLANVYQRHCGLLQHNIGLNTAAWALVDSAGDSRLGCWPLHIGEQRFTLTIAGLPQLNQPAFIELIWILSVRYGAVSEEAIT